MERAVQAELLQRPDWARHYWQIASATADFDRWDRLGAAWNAGSEADLARAEAAYRAHLVRHPEDAAARSALIEVLLRARRIDRAEIEAKLLPAGDRQRWRQRFLEVTDPGAGWNVDAAELPDGAATEEIERTVRRALAADRPGDVALLADRLLATNPLSARATHLALRVAREAGDAARTERIVARLAFLDSLRRAEQNPEEDASRMLEREFPQLAEPCPEERSREANLPPGDLVDWRARLRWMQAQLRARRASALAAHLVCWSERANAGSLRSFADELVRAGFTSEASTLYLAGTRRFRESPGFWARAIELSLDRGDSQNARRLLQEAEHACGEVASFLWLAAELSLLDGDEERALELLQRSVVLVPWHLDPAEDLAALLAARGRREEALALLQGLPSEHATAVAQQIERLGLR